LLPYFKFGLKISKVAEQESQEQQQQQQLFIEKVHFVIHCSAIAFWLRINLEGNKTFISFYLKIIISKHFAC